MPCHVGNEKKGREGRREGGVKKLEYRLTNHVEKGEETVKRVKI